jgi:hypothetical protein
LRRSIDKGMQPNHAGQHINYLEIYERDVLAEEMQPVLRYAASLFEGNQPSERSPTAGRRERGEQSHQGSQTGRRGSRRRNQHNQEDQ